eukprot:CAMPEP_0185752226 /NCGR_PEP_ID=MMETSP1174-20130828/11028_1 /TAXON_ID=35687 /ORGANISM="Dictyocha speculum, Strain CCMP1381" /LENGTH=670 /DNA_ID=CAMNT_0028429587 /DNA_START=210 /DNA_END=2222 /DNA_ORIENTATION=+
MRRQAREIMDGAERLRLVTERDELIAKKAELTERLDKVKRIDSILGSMTSIMVSETDTSYEAMLSEFSDFSDEDVFRRIDYLLSNETDKSAFKQLVTLRNGLMAIIMGMDDSERAAKLEDYSMPDATAQKMRNMLSETNESVRNVLEQLSKDGDFESVTVSMPLDKTMLDSANTINGTKVVFVQAKDADERSQDEMFQEWIKLFESVGGDASSQSNGNLTVWNSFVREYVEDKVPAWVPQTLVPVVEQAENIPDISDELIDRLEKEVFTKDLYYLTKVDSSSKKAILFKGNLRLKNSDEVYERIQKNLEAIPELNSQVNLFFQKFPLEMLQQIDSGISIGDLERSIEEEPRPVFMVLRKEAVPAKPGAGPLTFAAVSAALSATGIFTVALSSFALNENFVQAIENNDLSVVSDVMPVALGLAGIQLIHELGHKGVAQYYGIKLGWPVFIPSLQVGCFGAVTKFLSYPKNRAELFDLSLAGPICGYLASLIALVLGLSLTGSSTPEMAAVFPVISTGSLSSSALISTITTALLPQAFDLPPTALISVHPLAIVGMTGLLFNALNSLPVGRLDGGRATGAVYGRPTATLVGSIVLLVQALSGLSDEPSIQLFWGLFILFFQRGQDIPAKDEVSEPGGARTNFYAAFLIFTLLCLVPFPVDLTTAVVNDPFKF